MGSSEHNADQIKYWNEAAGAKWVAHQDALDRQMEPIAAATIEAAAIAPSERVLDVGCGCGATSIEIARRASRGSVVGVDISGPMLARARERAAAARVANVGFEQADAQSHRFGGPPFDVVFSRFGVMFFDDPTAAFTNLRSATREGGRLAFACWQPFERNPWMAVPAHAAATVITMPPRPAPGTPGPFAFSDPDYVRDILTRAGYRDLVVASHTAPMSVGTAVGTLDDAARFAMQFGPTATAMRDAPPDAIPRVFEAVRAALETFVTPNGVVIPAAVWIVTATK
jgi:SAM-dependent methyltransferase